MSDAVCGDGRFEGRRDMLLTDQVGEDLRTVTPCDHDIVVARSVLSLGQTLVFFLRHDILRAAIPSPALSGDATRGPPHKKMTAYGC